MSPAFEPWLPSSECALEFACSAVELAILVLWCGGAKDYSALLEELDVPFSGLWQLRVFQGARYAAFGAT